MNNVTTQSIPHTEHFIINIASVVTFNTLMYWPIKEYVFACFSCLAYIWLFLPQCKQLYKFDALSFPNKVRSTSSTGFIRGEKVAWAIYASLTC